MSNGAILKISAPEAHGFWKVLVLRETPGLLAIDKPPHLLVAPEKHRAEHPILTRLLQRDIANTTAWAKNRDLAFLDLIYPLDFESTGVVLYATEKNICAELHNQLGSRQIQLQFTALVHRCTQEDEFEVDLKLAPHPTKRWLTRVNRSKGKQCLTQCRVLERFREFTLLRCLTTTLRQHQIRVHLAQSDHPVVGDSLYRGDLLMLSHLKPKYRPKRRVPEKPLIDRVAVHLSEVRFKDPTTEQVTIVKSTLPKDLQVALKFLRRYGR
ncbi:MAG: putative RNA pseudouridine synthase [Verrucomicrobia subdivision 3 bacterium]|nr:putative RNA pseudouridine synthase [Limisphaerales bacterium]MCS1413859.1 putative RNA pseudouridine synthase [Limisphaerales bacterium]